MLRSIALAMFLLFDAASTLSQEVAPQANKSRAQVLKELTDQIFTLDKTYRKNIADLDAAYATKVRALCASAITDLAELQKSVAAEDLDEAIRLREAANQVRNHPQTPPKQAPRDKATRDKQIAELTAKVASLEEQLAENRGLAKSVTGKSYRVNFSGGERAIWTFADDGILVRDGKATETRWTQCGKGSIVCVSMGSGYVDVCTFADDLSTIEIMFAGSFRNSNVQHHGRLILP